MHTKWSFFTEGWFCKEGLQLGSRNVTIVLLLQIQKLCSSTIDNARQTIKNLQRNAIQFDHMTVTNVSIFSLSHHYREIAKRATWLGHHILPQRRETPLQWLSIAVQVSLIETYYQDTYRCPSRSFSSHRSHLLDARARPRRTDPCPRARSFSRRPPSSPCRECESSEWLHSFEWLNW